MRYDAFISYSHGAERAFAQVLQGALQRFAKPWYRRRSLRVYRDETNLAANPDLWKTLQGALDESRFLILLASPASAASAWVPREIGHWQARHEAGTILLVLVGGDIAWDDEAKDFDWNRTTALSRALSGSFPDQPLFVDLRAQVDRGDVSDRDPDFQAGVARLAAALHGRELDEILGEDLREHRRTRRIAWSAVTTLAVLAVLAVTAAIIARHQNTLSRSREEAARAVANLPEDPETSVRHALAGVQISATRDAEQALRLVLPQLFLLGAYRISGDTVTSAALAPDGSRLVTGGLRNAVWRVGSDGPPLRLADPGGPVAAVAFSPSGETIAFATVFRRVGLWDAASGKVERLTEELPESFVAVRFDQGGTVLHAGGVDAKRKQAMVRTWRLPTWTSEAVPGALLEPDWLARETDEGGWAILRTDTGEPVAQIPYGEEPGLPLAVAPNGSLLAEAHGNDVWIRHTGSGRTLFRLVGHDATVNAAMFDPARRRLITASDDFTARVWDLRRDAATQTILRGHLDAVEDARLSPNGLWIVTASKDRTARMWHAVTGEMLAVFRGHREDIRGLAFHPDGSSVMTFAGDGARLWRVTTDQSLLAMPAGPEVRHADFSPDRQWMLASSPLSGESTLCRFWTHERDFRFAQGVLSAVFGPGGRRFAAGTYDGRALVMEVGPPRRMVGSPLPHDGMVLAVAFDPDSDSRLFTGDQEGSVRRFALGDGEAWKGAVLYRHEAMVASLAPRGDGRFVVSGGGDRMLRGWDLERARAMPPLEHPAPIVSVALTADGERAAAAAGDAVHLWNLKTRRRIAVLPHPSQVWSCAFTPDGRWLVTCAHEDKELRLWNAMSGAPETSMRLHGAFARWAGVSRDGKYVFTVEQDDTVRAYPWERLAPVEELRDLARERLSQIRP